MYDIDQIRMDAEAEVSENAVMDVLTGDIFLNSMLAAALPGGNRKECVRELLNQMVEEAFVTGFLRGHLNGVTNATEILKGEIDV